MSLRTRLLVLSLIGVFGLAVFAGLLIREELVERSNALASIRNVVNARSLSALVHELQKERGLSAGLIGADGGAFVDKLDAQRGVVDERIALARLVLENAARRDNAHAATASGMLDALAAMRADVSMLRVPIGRMAAYYVGLVDALLSLESGLVTASHKPDLVRKGTVLMQLEYAKEAAGVERAMGANGFGAGAFAPAVYRDMIGLIDRQTTALRRATINATPAHADALEAVLVDPRMQRIEAMRAVALASPQTGDLGGVSGEDWFEAATQRIDLLKELLDTIKHDFVLAAEATARDADRLIAMTLAVLVALISVCLGVAMVMSGRLTHAIRTLIGELERIGRAEVDFEVSFVERRDEIGEFARALAVCQRSEARRIEQQEEIRLKSSTERAQGRRLRDAISLFRTNSEAILEELLGAARSLDSTSSTLEEAVDVTQSGSNEASGSAEEARTSVGSVAAAVRQLASAVHAVTARVDEALAQSETATATAQKAAERIAGLETASQAITNATSMIADIAAQTNLLALNATIEAERAGAAGRGFAVVASEVKTLADNTSRATDDIARQIRDIQTETNFAVGNIGEVLERCRAMSGAATAIRDVMREQEEVSADIASSVDQLSGNSARSSSLAARVLAAAQSTVGAIGAVRGAAGGMDEISQRFRKEIAAFLSAVARA
ncbi:MAG: methyl-accepting chemotaxis protein [Acuticoccus sp.]